jgi:hypothetical protein
MNKKSEIIKFFRDFEPICKKSDASDFYEVFTVPTQRLYGFSSYDEAIEHCMKFIKNGNWQPKESPLSRFLKKIEKD